MGCSYDFGCKTCKKAYYLGSSSYSSWLTFETAKEYDEAAGLHHRDKRNLKQYRINQDIRRLLGEHDGHETFYVGWDWSSVEGGKLYSDTGPYGASELWIEDWGDYEHRNLEREADRAAGER